MPSWPTRSSAPAPTLAWPHAHIDVWQLALPTQVDGATEALLTRDERDRAHRHHHAVDRVRSLFSRASLRRLLGAYLRLPPAAVALAEGLHGKPVLAHACSGLHFNTSHSGDWVLHAFGCGAALGIDIERPPPRGYDSGMLRGYLTPRERARLAPLPPDALQREALRLWVRKEAWLKALGTGLSRDPATLELDEAVAACALRELPAPPGYVVALARLGAAWPVRVHGPSVKREAPVELASPRIAR